MTKTVMITGGSSGIGLSTARKLSKGKYRVIISARTHDHLEKALKNIPGEASGVILDYTRPETIHMAFAEIGDFDHLILVGAGSPAWGQFSGLQIEILEQAFSNKFFGFFSCAQAALPGLSKDGSITFVSGAAARTPFPGGCGLAAVNGAINALALTLAKELAPIRVNTVSPGLTRTPAYDYMEKAEREAFYQKIGTSLPVGRAGEADEIADAICFIVGNNFVTGSILDVDGGTRLS